MENMEKGITVPKWVLIVCLKIPQIPQNLSAQIVCPSPKVLDFNEKRLYWVSLVHDPRCQLFAIMYFYVWSNITSCSIWKNVINCRAVGSSINLGGQAKSYTPSNIMSIVCFSPKKYTLKPKLTICPLLC